MSDQPIKNGMPVEQIQRLLGERLRQARLNRNLTQADVAEQIGADRRLVANAEKGEATLVTVVGILSVLGLVDQLDQFLPPVGISPIQLAKLQGQRRQRATGSRGHSQDQDSASEDSSW
ncbi:helix-turn-helix transcriptional regulator [Pokkaliibacter sp. CJK22405]|uniref:helix-turn-helix transcriptional regulator n=1 Tax=Pokkaliibacter sp. CJK22405 TaxID=3384615 RepID=UPI00398463E9